METYAAPVTDLQFVIENLLGYDNISGLEPFGDVTPELGGAILKEAAKFSDEILAPLNRVGDQQGCVLENGVVRTPEGFPDAYRQMIDAGWISMAAPEEYGGQNLPTVFAIAAFEMWSAANTAFGLVPVLSQSAIDLMLEHADPGLKQTYLHKMVSGEWTTTMNLTEPQAGSDLSLLRTKAVKEDDHYRISGQKIYISGGDHDLSDNIVHLVLARLPDAPPGNRGISLFLVPKYLVRENGELGNRNDLRPLSLETKLGIHGNPTCVMSYGDNGGAVGYLIGGENQGLAGMFTMMNLARLMVGLQGVAITERAYQQALSYAKDRLQGSRSNGTDAPSLAPIIHHPDVKRMLLDMKCIAEAGRCLTLYAAYCIDLSKRHADAATRQKFSDRLSLLTPVVKAWITDRAIDCASTGIQVHGGLGYIEDTGAAQHFRDARIMAIYEGTNGIQANDLIGRKIVREYGTSMLGLISEMKEDLAGAKAADGEALAAILSATRQSVDDLDSAVDWILGSASDDPDGVSAGAAAFLKLSGDAICGWLVAKCAIATQNLLDQGENKSEPLKGRILSARHFAETFLPQTKAALSTLRSGQPAITEMSEAMFG